MSGTRFAAKLAVTCALSVTALYAQSAHGTIRGTISGAETKTPISNAQVSIDNPARTSATNDKGEFVIRDLPAGSYDVTTVAAGRQPAHCTVTVTAGGSVKLDIALKPGSLMLSGIVVSATRTATDASQSASTVNMLTAEQVRASPGREVQDMLREIPGIEMPRTSSEVGGTAQTVSIRGVDEGRTAVLLDGIPLNDAWGEWIDWNRAPKGSIDHVEVMEGGGANLYGNGAIGGVINLFSRPISPGAYHFVVDGGDRGAHHFYGQAGMALGGGFAFGLSGDYGEGGGYQLIEPGQGAGPIDRASTSILRNLAGRLEYAPSADFSAFLSGHLFSDYRHLGTPLTSAARTDGATTAGFNYGNSNSGALNVRLWVRDMKETDVGSSLLTVNGVARADERLNNIAQIPSYDRGISLVWNRNNLLGFQSFSVGGDYRYMGGFYDEQDYNNNAANAPSTHFNSGGNQSLSGVFVSGVLAPAADWRIELSGRVDNWANNDGVASTPSGNATYPNSSKMSFSPRVGVRYQVTPDFSMHTAVYQAFRAPNLAELYRAQASATVITIPNPSLKPEYGTGYELGLDWQPAPWIQLKGTIYQADYNDFNTFVTTVNTPPAVNTRMRENVQKARSQGGEIYLALRPIDHFTFSGSFNYDDDRITDLGPNAPSTTTFVSARIGRVPIQKATGKAQYDSPLIGTWMVMGRYEGSNTTLGNSFTLPEFGVADASWNKPLMGGLSIFASIENIFDRKYQVNFSGSTSAPIVTLGLPRTVRAGFDLTKF